VARAGFPSLSDQIDPALEAGEDSGGVFDCVEVLTFGDVAVEEVGFCSAGQFVDSVALGGRCAASADQRVRAGFSEHCVGSVVTDQRVAARAAEELIVAGVARQPVVAFSAQQRVVATAAAVQDVVARAAVERVIEARAQQGVVASAAEDADHDALAREAGRINHVVRIRAEDQQCLHLGELAADRRFEAVRAIDLHVAGDLFDHDVVARSTVQIVLAGATRQSISRASLATQPVVAFATIQRVGP